MLPKLNRSQRTDLAIVLGSLKPRQIKIGKQKMDDVADLDFVKDHIRNGYHADFAHKIKQGSSPEQAHEFAIYHAGFRADSYNSADDVLPYPQVRALMQGRLL